MNEDTWYCSACGKWVLNGVEHTCITLVNTYCSRCKQWVRGNEPHICSVATQPTIDFKWDEWKPTPIIISAGPDWQRITDLLERIAVALERLDK